MHDFESIWIMMSILKTEYRVFFSQPNAYAVLLLKWMFNLILLRSLTVGVCWYVDGGALRGKKHSGGIPIDLIAHIDSILKSNKFNNDDVSQLIGNGFYDHRHWRWITFCSLKKSSFQLLIENFNFNLHFFPICFEIFACEPREYDEA